MGLTAFEVEISAIWRSQAALNLNAFEVGVADDAAAAAADVGATPLDCSRHSSYMAYAGAAAG